MAPEVEGLQLGHYQLTRRIGAGGMGEVYLARDLALKRDVAIKFVVTEKAPDPSLARRLMHEAQAVAALDHPCICPVHDVGVDPAGRPYMVMQYVAGETLAARVARGPLHTREALDVCASIADALAAAHRHGIIHRDLKPQNVMLTTGGGVKLLDFGIAKLVPEAGAPDPTSSTASSLSAAHAIVGTPAYMSPEQVLRRPVDARSDLFSLGAILYETLTGERAFPGRSLPEVLGAVLHAQPPCPSERRPDLDDQHDELVRRLLAKEPADRFQSADEVVGALRLLLPDTSRTPAPPVPPRPVRVTPLRWARHHRMLLLGVAAVVTAAAIAAPRYFGSRLPAMPHDALVWYDRGTDALRKGSFYTAAAAFEESVKLFPNHPLPYARLAETRTELDDENGAQAALVSVSALVPNESRLPEDERLRLAAIRALVLRKVDDAVALYRALVNRNASDPTAWVDLGRAQEAAAQPADARASYERAVALGSQFPAAFLRLGMILSSEGERDKGMAAFSEAERLYRTAKDAEGEAEVLIRKAAVLDGRGEYTDAGALLERALALARAADNQPLVVRAELRRSSLLVSQGKLDEAERLAASTVQAASDAGLHALAADGLIDVAFVMQSRNKPDVAEATARRALELAERQHAERTAGRARTQLAALLQSAGRSEDALEVLPPALEFFKRNNYRWLELTASNIAARALQRLDRVDEARTTLTGVLAVAERIKDQRQVALALTGLCTIAFNKGELPEALRLRLQAEAIHREQQDAQTLPFDLTNRAETEILMGRFAEADAALKEVETAIEQKRETYVGRRSKVLYLRALAAALANDYRQAVSLAAGPGTSTDTIGVMLANVHAWASARMGKPTRPADADASSVSPAIERELSYWGAATALAAGHTVDALARAEAGLGLLARFPNDELEWRLAAVGAAAAGSLRQPDAQRALRDRAGAALDRLRKTWGDAARQYEIRPDLVALRTAAGL